MDNYFEQSVAGERGPREQFTYAACWVAIVILAIVGVFAAMGVVNPEAGGFGINWLNLVVFAVAVALAILLYRLKDNSFPEYDYILWNSELEICAVYNRQRRKKLATIPLNRVSAWGPASAMRGRMRGAKARNWYVHADAAWCLLYSGEAGNEAAVLELSDEMRAQLRSTNRALRGSEVKQ